MKTGAEDELIEFRSPQRPSQLKTSSIDALITGSTMTDDELLSWVNQNIPFVPDQTLSRLLNQLQNLNGNDSDLLDGVLEVLLIDDDERQMHITENTINPRLAITEPEAASAIIAGWTDEDRQHLLGMDTSCSNELWTLLYDARLLDARLKSSKCVDAWRRLVN